MNMETKVMMMSIVMRVYLIFWIIISAYGMQNADVPERENCSLAKDNCKFNSEAGKCRFRELKVIMFSKKVYDCENTCSGYLIKERSNKSLFYVYFYRQCNMAGEGCVHKAFILHDDLNFQLGEMFEILSTNGRRHYKIEVSPSNPVKEIEKGYSILMIGDTIQFLSTKYGFTVTWRVNNFIDIEVSSCLLNQIVGLCGYYTKEKINDKRIETGDGLDDLCGYFSLPYNNAPCVTEIPYKRNWSIINTAEKACKNIRQLVGQECKFEMNKNKIFVSYDAIMNACPFIIYPYCSRFTECNCEALKYFIENRICGNISLKKYFRMYNCVLCPNGFEWKSCGYDETCDSIKSDKSMNRLVQGCVCPEGLVKVNDQCRPITDCTAKCNVYGGPYYRTFDHKNFRFRGNCSENYVLVQTKTNEPHIQILGVNERCKNFPNSICIVGVIIKYENSILEVYGNKTIFFDKEIVTCNYKDAYCSLGKIYFTEITELNTFQINITEYFVGVNYKLLNSDQYSLRSITVELPKIIFYNKTEGLCGVYNDDDFDDFSLQNGVIVDDVNAFVSDWIYEDRKNCSSSITECYFKSHEKCSSVDTTGFHKQHIETCKADFGDRDITYVDMCKYKIFYAEDCCDRHVPIDRWLQEENCHIPCKANQTFRCVDVCETKCPIDRSDRCANGKLYTMMCACPEGYVEKNNKCIKRNECDNCTAKPNLNIPAGFYNIDNCTNQKPILNRRQCLGECSASFYGIDGYYAKNCSWCTPSVHQKVDIPLYCNKNDSTILFSISEPIDCICKPCDWYEKLIIYS